MNNLVDNCMKLGFSLRLVTNTDGVPGATWHRPVFSAANAREPVRSACLLSVY